MKLSLIIPHRHFHDFVDYSDFVTIVAGRKKKSLALNKPYYTLCVDMRTTPCLEVHGTLRSKALIVGPDIEQVFSALAVLESDEVIAIVRTNSEYKTLYRYVGSNIAVPHTAHIFRSHQLSKEQCRFIFYLGFKSLDELRTRPPKALITSMPFAAAHYGIDLRKRERRPKNVKFNFDIRLTKSQLKLAESNIKAIKEAASDL